jgi:hypothetical protein
MQISVRSVCYSRFHETLTTNVPLRCEVQKFIMRFTNQFVNYAFDWLLLIQGPIRDFFYKLACEFQYELANICGSSEHLWSKFREIDCNMRSRLSLEKKTEPGYAGYPLVGNKTKMYQVYVELMHSMH